ncbi:MAG TPA: nucleoid-associated protein [Anaerolineales bacterium]|nr:nucleoid-associated protein [Anaerolineales bacterium]
MRAAEFDIRRVALHLVDLGLPTPFFAAGEIDLAGFGGERELAAMEAFFGGHLARLWAAPENSKTRAARFLPNSVAERYFAEIVADPGRFYTRSRDLAQRLYDVSSGRQASPGLLMIVLFRKDHDSRDFLALLKMDPGRVNRVALRQSEYGEIMLDLAVQSIDQALPSVDDRLLKWAVTPHPTRPAFDVKVRDDQAGADIAQYFMDFLGCEERKTEKEQLEDFFAAFPDYAAEAHPAEDWNAALQTVYRDLEKAPLITPTAVEHTVAAAGVLPGFDPARFNQRLADYEIDDLNVRPNVLRNARRVIKLSNGIEIRGLREAMESAVEIVETPGEGYTIIVHAADFLEGYA